MALASMVCVLGSCNNGEKDPVTNDASEYITISTNILTRVAVAENGSQEFENGDKISVYAWTGSKASVPDISQRVVDSAHKHACWRNLAGCSSNVMEEHER